MNKFSIKELEKIINEGNFDYLIGKIENNFFDCKKEIYDLKNNLVKRELAKDISSFANLNGGYILIGPQTKKSKYHFGDEIEKIKLVKQNLVNIDQYFDVAKEWIYPEIERLKIKWKPSKNDKNKGILVIQIPSQKEILKPFLIKKLVEERKISEIIFGYVERKGDKGDPKKIQNIHQIMRDGLLYDQNIKNHFNYLESLIMERNQQTQKEKQVNKNKEIENTIKERIKTIIKANNINNQRAFILTVYIKNNVVELKSLFTDVEGSIKRKLENPPVNAGKIRSGGWSLETLDRGKIIEGQLVRVMHGVKIIDLYKDGTLVFTGLANEEFLAWASKDGLKINSLALIELVYNFISFYKEVIDDLSEQPSMISVKFGFINMWLNNKKSYLVPGPTGSLFNKYDAPQNKYFSEPIDFNIKVFNKSKIAYKVVEEIYLCFGIPLNNRNIPYTKKLKDSSIIIDVDQIKN
jgi:predicted phosphohydrolase